MTQVSTKRKKSAEVIIFLGTAGSGKSTLISALTDKKVITSNKSKSCTKISKLFPCKLDKSIHLLDTVGTEDTDGMTTEEILVDMCKTVGNKGQHVKVVWVITPNVRSSPQLQAQARFINCLSPTIWNSTIIICKKGSESDDSQGASDAAAKYTKNKLKSYNIDIYDIDKNRKLNKMYKMMTKVSYDERIKDEDFILLKYSEAKKWLYSKLKNIKCSKIEMKQISYHSSDYTEGKEHTGKWCINNWEMTKLVGTGIGVGAGSAIIGVAGGLAGGSVVLGETLVGTELVTAGLTSLGFGGAVGGTATGLMSGVNKKVKEYCDVRKWDCCNQKGKHAPGCKTYYKCIWCNKKIKKNNGCKKSWVPKNYIHNPKKYLVKN